MPVLSTPFLLKSRTIHIYVKANVSRRTSTHLTKVMSDQLLTQPCRTSASWPAESAVKLCQLPQPESAEQTWLGIPWLLLPVFYFLEDLLCWISLISAQFCSNHYSITCKLSLEMFELTPWRASFICGRDHGMVFDEPWTLDWSIFYKK